MTTNHAVLEAAILTASQAKAVSITAAEIARQSAIASATSTYLVNGFVSATNWPAYNAAIGAADAARALAITAAEAARQSTVGAAANVLRGQGESP